MKYETVKIIADDAGNQLRIGDLVTIKDGNGGGCGNCRITKITDNGFHFVQGSRVKMAAYDSVAEIRLQEPAVEMIKFYARGESSPHDIYFPIVKEPFTETVYEVRFDVGVKETMQCLGSYKWKLIHQETGEVIIVDTKTVFRNVSSFYEYTVETKYGPKIYSIKKWNEMKRSEV